MNGSYYKTSSIRNELESLKKLIRTNKEKQNSNERQKENIKSLQETKIKNKIIGNIKAEVY